jgi:hypothetical protein
MTDPPPYPTGEDPGREVDQDTTGVPRWVKVSGVIFGVLVVLVIVVLALTGTLGQHGPGRHGP